MNYKNLILNNNFKLNYKLQTLLYSTQNTETLKLLSLNDNTSQRIKIKVIKQLSQSKYSVYSVSYIISKSKLSTKTQLFIIKEFPLHFTLALANSKYISYKAQTELSKSKCSITIRQLLNNNSIKDNNIIKILNNYKQFMRFYSSSVLQDYTNSLIHRNSSKIEECLLEFNDYYVNQILASNSKFKKIQYKLLKYFENCCIPLIPRLYRNPSLDNKIKLYLEKRYTNEFLD